MVIEAQDAAREHIHPLRNQMRAKHAELVQRQDEVEALSARARQKLNSHPDIATPLPPHKGHALHEQASKKTRRGEQGHTCDASPAACAQLTLCATASEGTNSHPNVASGSSSRQPRSSARRSASVPAPDKQHDDVVLLRFKTPHSEGFLRAWLRLLNVSRKNCLRTRSGFPAFMITPL